eukprot:280316_1
MGDCNIPERTDSISEPKNTSQVDKVVNSIRFCSTFDSGNLSKVLKSEYSAPLWFDLYLSADYGRKGIDTQTWFHFFVEGVPYGSTLTFTIKNMRNQTHLFGHGHRPVIKCEPHAPEWELMDHACNFRRRKTNLELTFSHTWKMPDKRVYFAFTFPFSYPDIQKMLSETDTRMAGVDPESNIFYQRETLTWSVECRRIDLLTISSRPFNPNSCKPVVIISARVHPGETPSSFVFKGALEFLLSSDQRARILRAVFVFLMIPCLNPDGVARGNYRTDTLGHDLNRYYINPSPDLHPSVFAVKKILRKYSNRLEFYIDLHAHSSKRGIFMYGNSLPNDDHIENVLFAKLMSINCEHFDFGACNFSARHMRIKDRLIRPLETRD